ncbi:glycoside hydrolase family 30 protein [bacterium]|nr:glycoside hydrolase family 30 protein [bacterium]
MIKHNNNMFCLWLLCSILIGAVFHCQKQKIPANLYIREKAEVYVTAKETGQRLSKEKPIKFTEHLQPVENEATLIIDASKTFQTMIGFGGALTDAAAETYYQLPGDKQKQVLQDYFDPEEGLGYTFCRIPIHTCDFSSESGSYAEVANDTLLEHFSIDRDRPYRLPFIKAAIKAAGDTLTLFASPWSPPAWMKTNNSMLQGGKLKKEYRQSWADYYVRFIRAYKMENIPIWGLTVQNEPMAVQTWESCIYTAQEERDFVRDYLGPTLVKNGLSHVKLMIWDHNRGILYQRAKVVLDDPEASKYVWGVGFHWYVGNHFENVRLVHDAFPDKQLVFTEGCVYSYEGERLNEWHWGERYGESVLMDLNNGSVGWVDWNILLDENGGPNHVSNYCFAPIHGNTQTGGLHYMNSYHYLGHFSKFIRPGSRRIIASSNDDQLLTTAFINPDGRISVIVLNMTDEAIPFHLWMESRSASANSPAHSIITLVM